MSEIKWGIVSTGRISGWFMEDLKLVPNGKAVAVCSRSLDRAAAFAKEFDIPNAHGSYEELLADREVDIVYIGTPHTQHKQNILDAFSAGKHVLCEKPIVTSVADMKDVLDAAHASDVYLMEAMWTYHLPAMRNALEWVRQGRIGKIVQIKTDFGYPVPYSPDQREYDANDAGGALREMGIYPIAIARAFLGDYTAEPTALYTLHKDAPNGVEQDLTALFQFGEVTVNLSTSYRARLGNDAKILGENGWIHIPNAFRCQQATLYHLDDAIEESEHERTSRGYHYQAIAAGQDILEGRTESPIVPHAASLAFQKDIAAILNSTGRGEN